MNAQIQEEISIMVSATVLQTRRISIKDLLNFKDSVECTTIRTHGDSIELIVMPGADTASLGSD